MATKKIKKRRIIMTIEIPKAHEVPGAVALQMLGYTELASVRRLVALGKITARKINRDLWYDRKTIEAYVADRKKPGRPVGSVLSTKKPRSNKDKAAAAEREAMRIYQQKRRAKQKKDAKAAAKSGSVKSATKTGRKG